MPQRSDQNQGRENQKKVKFLLHLLINYQLKKKKMKRKLKNRRKILKINLKKRINQRRLRKLDTNT